MGGGGGGGGMRTKFSVQLWSQAEHKKTKNDLRVMKRILYDMGPLTLVRWLLQRALKFGPPFGPRSKLKRVPPPKNFKNNIVSKVIIWQNPVVFAKLSSSWQSSAS